MIDYNFRVATNVAVPRVIKAKAVLCRVNGEGVGVVSSRVRSGRLGLVGGCERRVEGGSSDRAQSRACDRAVTFGNENAWKPVRHAGSMIQYSCLHIITIEVEDILQMWRHIKFVSEGCMHGYC